MRQNTCYANAQHLSALADRRESGTGILIIQLRTSRLGWCQRDERGGLAAGCAGLPPLRRPDLTAVRNRYDPWISESEVARTRLLMLTNFLRLWRVAAFAESEAGPK